jgi:hypothetical protein
MVGISPLKPPSPRPETLAARKHAEQPVVERHLFEVKLSRCSSGQEEIGVIRIVKLGMLDGIGPVCVA